MTKKDLYEAGDQIKRIVQDAVDSQDFSSLSSTITDVVDEAMDGLQTILKDSLSSAGRAYQRTNSEAAERIRREMEEKRKARLQASREKSKLKKPVVIRGEVSGQVKKWAGFSMAGIFGFAMAILGIVAFTTGAPLLIPFGILGVCFGGSMWLGESGKKRLGIVRRFKRYQEILGDRKYCLVEELAALTGQKEAYVRKDLRKMIEEGYFREGHLDGREMLFITDDQTYRQYIETQTEYERRKAMGLEPGMNSGRTGNEPQKEVDPEQVKKLSPECRAIIEEGQKYIQHIHECNQRIPGEEITAKLDRLELVITKIFREVEKNPSTATELRKMMSYYLPTTQKLLDTYCNLEAQQIKGQNIDSTKKEIEAALDTISTAFETLLDSFFQDTAWDISSDISVMKTMMAQEGLTGSSGFSK